MTNGYFRKVAEILADRGGPCGASFDGSDDDRNVLGLGSRLGGLVDGQAPSSYADGPHGEEKDQFCLSLQLDRFGQGSGSRPLALAQTVN